MRFDATLSERPPRIIDRPSGMIRSGSPIGTIAALGWLTRAVLGAPLVVARSGAPKATILALSNDVRVH